jgi:hypothetical protein
MTEVSTIKQDVIRQLDQLPPELQRQVLDFAHALAVSAPKGVQGKRLLSFSGIMETEDIQAMSEAIEAGCERVDMNEW